MLYCSIVCCPIRTSELFVRVIISILWYVHVLVVLLSCCALSVLLCCAVLVVCFVVLQFFSLDWLVCVAPVYVGVLIVFVVCYELSLDWLVCVLRMGNCVWSVACIVIVAAPAAARCRSCEPCFAWLAWCGCRRVCKVQNRLPLPPR